jgi:hypothetical protein
MVIDKEKYHYTSNPYVAAYLRTQGITPERIVRNEKDKIVFVYIKDKKLLEVIDRFKQDKEIVAYIQYLRLVFKNIAVLRNKERDKNDV